ncbi:hypothetical protein G7045_01360 [Acidovorax sp. HDW3]|uniref:hypothetical protein n=1 Tax=Acidovorax sp. HDW3 TaxID=2714923 RepID=UPI00140C5DCD|nr:hypothetical protein [Acidovorax sp. HDW3]QIL43016.1 hypothetical protein G7045_01360 [Acidovorax sp. HDW3]
MARATSRLRTELRDLLELILLPGLAAVLPWPLCFRIFRRLARWDWLYHNACHTALAQARAHGWALDEADWLLKRRLITLVDHADFYLGRTRSDAWMARHLRVEGTWPAPGASGLLCTFHWGAGMWGLRHAHAQGLVAHALVAALEGAHFKGRAVLHWYARARTAEVARALGCPTLDVSASLRPALRALRQDEQVLAAIDVPSDQVAASEPVTLLGLRALMPKALLRLAVEQRIPMTLYLTGLDFATGKRFVRVQTLGVRDDVGTLAREVFQTLDHAIQAEPAAWHFWGEAPRFFHNP